MKLLILAVVLFSGVLANDDVVKPLSSVVAPTPSLHKTPSEVKKSTVNAKKSSAVIAVSSNAVPKNSTAVVPVKKSSAQNKQTSSVAVKFSSNHISPSTASAVASSNVVRNDTKSSKAVAPSSNAIVPSSSSPTVFSSTTPKPNPDRVVDFAYPNKTDACVNVTGDIHIQLTTDKASKKIKLGEHFMTDGKCMENGANMTYSMISILYNGNNGAKTLTFTMTFTKNYTSWYLSEVDVVINGTYRGHAAYVHKNRTENLYGGKVNNSYSCPALKELSLTSDQPKQYNITVMFKLLTIKPSPYASGVDFCTSKTTSKDTSSIVPIAVGCALAGLIVIVLIAYLIGRRKGNNRGYQQV